VPDIVCLSKGVTGGVMPVGLTVASQKIFEAFLSEETTKALLHGHSFTGNPLSCAAICASLDLFEQKQTMLNIERIVNSHHKFVQDNKDKTIFKSIKSLGTILSLEIELGEESGYFSDIRTKAYNYFLKHELLIRPLGNVIFFNPPYCISEAELNHTYRVILDFLGDLKK
jgi:adenosylmethionine-8-amino-7-oxononanoate aminotransferase